ncbi:hypothetical protein KKH43_02190 [Patescibacteria group bacterium]|nr:hypothetical protein [Patescibacteria group bacterium]
MNYLATLKKYWYIPVVIITIAFVLSLVASFVQTPKYQSSVKLLVIQQQGNRMDAYSAARSAETIAGVLSKMIYTTTFIEQVQESQFDLKSGLSDDVNNQKKEWKDMMAVEASGDGSLVVDVYHPERDQSEKYALAAAYVLVNHGRAYHGGDDQVEIKMVDQPFTSVSPASPNIVQNVGIGVFAGILVSVSLLLLLGFKNNTLIDTYQEVGTNPHEPIVKGKIPDIFGGTQKTEGLGLNLADKVEEVSNDEPTEKPVSEEFADAAHNVFVSVDTELEDKKEEVSETLLEEDDNNDPVPDKQVVEEKNDRNESHDELEVTPDSVPSPFEITEGDAKKAKPKEAEVKEIDDTPALPGDLSSAVVDDVTSEEDNKSQSDLLPSTSEDVRKKGKLPEDLKKNKKKDYYHPESVDSWLKSGKFKPQEG